MAKKGKYYTDPISFLDTCAGVIQRKREEGCDITKKLNEGGQPAGKGESPRCPKSKWTRVTVRAGNARLTRLDSLVTEAMWPELQKNLPVPGVNSNCSFT